MASLRARLFVGLGALVLVASLIAGIVAFSWAFDEANELQDAILEQVGFLAANNRLQTNFPPDSNVDAEARVVIEELPGPVDSAVSPAGGYTGFAAELPDGLHTVSRLGKEWRTLLRTREDGSRVAVSQLTASRDEIAHDSALRSVLPLAALVPCLMVLVGVVVRYSFRPVSRLAARLDAKQADHLETLPLDGMPRELIPFIASINRLLERVRGLFDQQRRFVADAAHELRTPITALSLQAENLGHTVSSSESLERLATLKTGITRTAHLLEQLLALARYETRPAAEIPTVRFDLVVREVAAEFVPLAQSLVVDLGFERIEAVSVRADPTALGVLVRNLIDNALRHSPACGRVDLTLFRDGYRGFFKVEDSGPGIPDAELSRVSEPFYRGSRPMGQGSGLGLSIVQRIVERHDGSLTLENLTTPSRSGLRVTVSLPAAGQSAASRSLVESDER